MSEGKDSVWYVYLIETQSGKLYTGISTDPDRRFQEHAGQSKAKGARFFKTSAPKKIVYREEHPDRASASRREAEIKKWPRQKKLLLCKSFPRQGKNLAKKLE